MRRGIKRGQHGETIYVNRFYSVRNGELGTKSVFADEARVLTKLVKTPNTVTANTAGNENTGNTLPNQGIEQALNSGKGKKLGIIRRLPDGYQTGVNQPVEKDLFYFHSDHLGSSNMITDAKGAVYQHLEYFPYGETWIEEGGSYGGNMPGYKFTGKELDPETGLYYYGARYYDPVVSVWLNPDPVLDKYLDGDPAGGIFVPQNLGVYSYSHNNPVVYKDPKGRWVLKAARIAWKVGVKGENLYSLVSGVVENAKVIADPNASWGEKLLAATDIALDVTTGVRIKDIKKGLNVVEKTAKKIKKRAEKAKKRQKRVRNPYGSKGKPDHQKKVEELDKKARSDFPDKDRYEVLREKKIKREGSRRNPDVQVVDKKTDKTVKVYEAERNPTWKRNKDREAEYDKLGVPHETHKVD